MQVLRGLSILLGILLIAVGMYILFLGIGAPIEISGLQLGSLKASIKGVMTGAIISAFGGVLVWLPMQFLKRTTTVEEETTEILGNKSRSKRRKITTIQYRPNDDD